MCDFRTIELDGTMWQYPTYFNEMKAIAAGTYGSVSSALTEDGVAVAIKKLSEPFQSVTHAQRAFREIRLLRYMQHENIIGLLDLYRHQPIQEAIYPDIYIVTELMGCDLRYILSTQEVSDQHVQYIVYQILRALKYIHSAGIVHRDISPSNIAVAENVDVKLLDFGLARTRSMTPMTGYIQKKWYRAPEVILMWGEYTEKVDMWSVGCILAELLTGTPLFPAHENHVQHLNLIVDLLGKPPQSYVNSIKSETIRAYVSAQLPDAPPKNFQDHFKLMNPNINPLAVDLMQKLLEYNPAARMSAAQAIAHPYLSQLHCPDDEPVAAVPFDDSFEKLALGIGDWKDLILREIDEFRSVKYEEPLPADYPELTPASALIGQQQSDHAQQDNGSGYPLHVPFEEMSLAEGTPEL